jgi:hypothetical protein
MPRQSGTDCALQHAHRDAIYQMIESIASPVVRHQAIANFPAYLGVQFETHKVPLTQQRLSWQELEREYQTRRWAFPGIPSISKTRPVVETPEPMTAPEPQVVVVAPETPAAPSLATLDVDALLKSERESRGVAVASTRSLRQMVEAHADLIWAESSNFPLFGLKICDFEGKPLVLMHTWLIKATCTDGRSLSYSCSGEVADIMLNKSKADRVYHDGGERISTLRTREGTLDLRVMLDGDQKRQGPLRDSLTHKPIKVSEYVKEPRIQEQLTDVYFRLTVYPVIYVENRVVRIWCNESVDDDGYKGGDIWKRRYRLVKGRAEPLTSRV